jgi:DNA polymerase I-like protein with 3'-5' exonuclease and polymerase domains
VAKIIKTSLTNPTKLKPLEKEWVYNGMDCVITHELLEVLLPQLCPYTARTYTFSKSLQGPVLEMRLRGVLVDKVRRGEVIDLFYEKLDALEENLSKIIREGVGFFGFNWRSSAHLRELFYDRLRIPPIRKRGQVTTDRAALERMEQYLVARPIISHLKAMRDLGKKISVLKTEIDTDGRIRTSYNIGGTETGRFSSSLSEFGTGGNLQNVEESLRSVLIADPRMKMGYFDAEQGESRVVGGIEWALFHDGRYLDACEGGDLHTNVAKLVWPTLNWTGDPRLDKALAEQLYYRHYSRRFMCKKIGHGTNYAGKPRTLAEQAKVDIDLIEEFQPKYFRAFPAHLRWHAHVEKTLIETGTIVTLTGRKRQFWGRRNDPETLREAIAYDPQGSLADIVNAGMYNVWEARAAQLLMQVHDAVVVQYPEEREDEIVPQILTQLRHPVDIGGGRQLVIPYGAKTGWNFGEYCCGDRSRKGCELCKRETNLEGLKSYAPGDKRRRPKEMSVLDRVFR